MKEVIIILTKPLKWMEESVQEDSLEISPQKSAGFDVSDDELFELMFVNEFWTG
ncbi:MAG: hypothetical protein PHF24_06475 [Syntrophomonas sp.]|nr:hypothetical protein [Syntrophomonas sp.]